MAKVKAGDTVQVHYHGKLNDGTTFDTSEGRAPLQFTVGNGQVIKGFDDALLEMEVGDKKTVEIPVDEAYGPVNEQMYLKFPKTDFPPDMNPEVGMQLNLSDNSGNQFPVMVMEVLEEEVVLDGNHPLAGKDLVFDIELVSVVG